MCCRKLVAHENGWGDLAGGGAGDWPWSTWQPAAAAVMAHQEQVIGAAACFLRALPAVTWCGPFEAAVKEHRVQNNSLRQAPWKPPRNDIIRSVFTTADQINLNDAEQSAASPKSLRFSTLTVCVCSCLILCHSPARLKNRIFLFIYLLYLFFHIFSSHLETPYFKKKLWW